MKKNADNVSLFVKVLGDVFLILALFVGILYIMAGVFTQIKNIYPADFFGLPEVIAMGAIFTLGVVASLFLIFTGRRKLLPVAFLVSSALSMAFLLYVFFVLLAEMNIKDNEPTFTSLKFIASFFLLMTLVMVIFSSVIPTIFLTKMYFNSLLHLIAYIVEAVLWVVVLVLMARKASPPTGLLVASFIFLRSGLYWWLLELRKEAKKKKKGTSASKGS